MLSLAFLASSALLQPTATPGLLAPAARPAPAITAQLGLEEERVESVKAAGIAAVSGSMLAAPVKATALLATKALSQWEFSTGALAFELALFGLVYRCTVRSEDNDMLKQGTVGAFALIRALCCTQVAKSDPGMWLQLGAYIGESTLAFGGAAAMLEYAFEKGWLRRIMPSGLPNPETGVPEYHYDYYNNNGYGYRGASYRNDRNDGYRGGSRDASYRGGGGYRNAGYSRDQQYGPQRSYQDGRPPRFGNMLPGRMVDRVGDNWNSYFRTRDADARRYQRGPSSRGGDRDYY